MKIAIGADHGGFELKEEIIKYLKLDVYSVYEDILVKYKGE